MKKSQLASRKVTSLIRKAVKSGNNILRELPWPNISGSDAVARAFAKDTLAVDRETDQKLDNDHKQDEI